MFAAMTLLTFVVFITLDYVITRRREAREAAALVPPLPVDLVRDGGLAPEPVWVAGFQLPDHLHYHRGHTWVRVISPDTAVVGIDDFARRLIGPAESVALPRPGSWLIQGGRGFSVESGPRAAEFLSPLGGKVVEVNRELVKDPDSCSDDPYGRGWLFKVRTSNLAANLRNLLSGRLARRWIEDAREQLELRLMTLSGSVLQDGGEPAPDFAEHLRPADWNELSETFLLPQPGLPDGPPSVRGGAR